MTDFSIALSIFHGSKMVDHILEFPRPEVGNCLNWDSTQYCSRNNAARNKDNKEVVTYFPSIGTPFRI